MRSGDKHVLQKFKEFKEISIFSLKREAENSPFDLKMAIKPFMAKCTSIILVGSFCENVRECCKITSQTNH